VPDAIAGAAATTTTMTTAPAPAAPPVPRTDCPPDVEALGRSTWTLLHSIAASYPLAPSAREQGDLRTFVGALGRLYPCWVCAEDFQRHLAAAPARVGSRDEFGRWLCDAHNAVNAKLGKPRFDCARWEERWATGWKDGSCD
jgi:mitochondrial FAD-linked sulfhydryl oxidase